MFEIPKFVTLLIQCNALKKIIFHVTHPGDDLLSSVMLKKKGPEIPASVMLSLLVTNKALTLSVDLACKRVFRLSRQMSIPKIYSDNYIYT